MRILLTKEVEVRARSRDTKYYESLGYKIPREKDKRGRERIPPDATIKVSIEDLPDGSNKLVKYQCDDCGDIHEVAYATIKYRKNSQYLKTGETLCSKCANHRMSGENSSNYKHGSTRYPEYRNNAKRRGIEFALTSDEFKELTEKPCHYCGGYSIEWNENSRGNGIDRKDPNKGYFIDNCVPCCSMCNFWKRSIPYEKFIRYIRRIYETTKDYQI